MAHHPNGHGTYGQHDPSHPQQTYQPYSPTTNSFDNQIRRTSSFDAGDDRTYGNAGRGGQQYVSSDAGATGYGSGNQDYRYEQAGGSYQQNLPMRGVSYRAAQGSYQQPYQPTAASPELHHYNPQQYSQPPPQQTQYAPYNPTATPATYTHQTYNPAAYQPSPELQRQSTFSSPYNSPFNRQSSFSQGPPVPPRPGASYSAHPTPNVGAYGSTPSPVPQHPGSAPLPPRPATYSPPLPPIPQRDPRASNQYNPNVEQQAYQPTGGAGHGGYENAYHSSSDYQSPPGYTAFNDRPSFSARMNTLNAQVTPPAPLAPSSSASPDTSRSPRRTDTLTRHPQARPLPGPPPESDSESDYFNNASLPQPPSAGDLSYDDLMKEIETAMDRPNPRPRGSSSQQAQDFRAPSRQNTGLATPTSGNFDITPDERYTHTHPNGHLEAVGSGQYINYGAFSDDSEAEAAAGLAAMQADDEREAAEHARRRSGNTSSLFDSHGSPAAITPEYTRPGEHSSSDSEYKVDMGLVGGGYDAHLHYDDNFHSTTEMAYETFLPRMNSMKSSDRSTDGRTSQTDSYVPMPTPDFGRPLPPIHAEVARVDTSGTGGLTEPSPHPRRMSFDDGDEATLLDSEHDIQRTPSNNSPVKDSMPDLFYHPGMSPHRPLPPAPAEAQDRIPHLIPAGTYQHTMLPPIQSQLDPKHPYPATADAFDVGGSNPVPRSTSFASTRSAPKVDQPIRSKTDADKAKLLRAMTSPRDSTFGSPQTTIGYDLPVLKKSFNPDKITQAQFKKCTEPWALSSIVQWLKYLVADADYLKEGALTHAIVSLCTFKVPTMNTTEAEKLGHKVLKDMFQAGVLLKEEEWVKLGPGELSGVLFQLTGTGCYSPKLHVTEGAGKCYSYHCMRTWKRIDLTQQMPQERKVEDWITFYKLKKEDLDGKDKKEIERQNILHEIITTEDGFMSQIDVLRLLYRDQLRSMQPPIIPAKKISSFLNDVFGPIDEVKKVNEDYLLGQLKYRQQEQGPWIVGFSDIFREWIRKAKAIYINYASGFPRADYLVRNEASRNIAFRMFLDQAREDKRSSRLSWDSYLKGPITRLQRYGLLLQTVHKNMIGDSEEKLNLQYAIDEVRAVTFECNAKVDEMTKKIELLELSQKLKLRKGMEKVELNLDHLGREIIIQGDLLRAGGRGLQWVETRAILFDHYLVLAKIDSAKDSAGGLKYERYDVSKMPIPMDLIVLESMNDDPVVKSSVKGLGAVTSTVSSRPQLATTGSGSTRGNSTSGPASIHTNITDTSSKSETSIPSSRSMITTTILDPGTKDDKIMYPFRVKHLGNPEVYTLYAPSASNRQEWCEAIIVAKTNHALALQQQNAEPFKLKVLADAAFGFDGSPSGPRPVMIRGTPLDRAIREAEQKYAGQPRPGPVCRAAVNCATVFNQPYGRLICAVGTDYGVFISEYDNPRGWVRSVQMSRVTQVTALEEFSLFLLISDKSLIAYPLDTVCSTSANLVPVQNDSTRRAPQKLSGTREVGFFASGKMKDRGLVFYKKKDGISSTFKVLEPVLQKAATSRSRFLPSSSRRGHTEFFREYDEFYIPAECYSLNLFHSSLAISTSRGVEVLTLDKKVPFSVPILRAEQPETQARLSSIASRIKDLKPLGMFRLAESEFLVAFEECAVYVDKYGDVSRSVVMEFVGRAKSACLFGQYLILFNDDFLEIRNSMNGRMKQVITGRDIKCLDDGGGGNTGSPSVPSLGGGLNGLGVQGFGAAPRTVKFCMQHPEFERCQLIVELLENDVRQEEFGQKDF